MSEDPGLIRPRGTRAKGGWGRGVLVALLAAALIAGAVFVSNRGGGADSGGPLVLQTTNLNLGKLVPGEHVVKFLSVSNTGSGALQVRVRTSNPVLRAHLSASRIPPGSDATLRMEFASNSWDAEGAFLESILLYSNAPQKPLEKITVRGTLRAPFDWQPKVPLVQPLRRGGPPSLLVHIRPRGSQPLGPVAVTSMVPFTYARAIREGSGYKIELSAQPGAPLGPLVGVVRVDTYNPSLPVFDIPVRTQVLHNVIVNPYQFDFGFLRAGDSASAHVQLVVRKGHSVGIVRVEPHVPAATVVTVTPAGVNSRITLRLPSAPSRWSLSGYVNVFTTDPSQPVVQVPVIGTVWMPKPFEQAAREGSDAGLYDALKAVFYLGEDKVSAARVVSTILGGVRDERSVSLLLRALHDPNWYVRQRAVNVLGFLRSSAALDQIRSAVTDDPQSDVRDAAQHALVRIEGVKALPSLLLALQDDDDYVRDDAAMLLGQLGDPRAIPALQAASDDPDSLVRQRVANALQALRNASPSP